MDRLFSYIQNLRIIDIIDIILVAFLIYRFVLFVKETRAEQLLKGIVVLFVLTFIANFFNMYTTRWILDLVLVYGVLALIIVFQPELRRALEQIGRGNILSKSLKQVQDEEIMEYTEEITTAMTSLARQKIGALVVIERQTGLNEFVESGTRLDADLSSELLINLFIPNTPLHDGAVIIRDGKILSASSFLPLTENKNLSKEFGTRHRAAIGVTERSDALVIVVSEETGIISVAENGKLKRYLDEETLKEILYNAFHEEEEGFFGLRLTEDDEDDR